MSGVVLQKKAFVFVLVFPLSTESLFVNLISDSSYSTKLCG